MAAREFHGIIHNTWDTALLRVADGHDDGQWQEPWFPSRIPGAGRIEPGHSGEWRGESDGIFEGTTGWARWAIRVLEISEGVEHFEYVQVNWTIPFWQVINPVLIWATVSRQNPNESNDFAPPDPRLPILECVAWRQTEHGLALPTGEDGRELGPVAQAGTLVSTFFIPNFSVVVHAIVPFTLRRRKVDQSESSLPLGRPAASGIIYAVTPRVEATPAQGIGPGMGAQPASGGDLLWARHTGRNDGRFAWDGPEKVGIGWSGFEHVFSGGDGIVYAVDRIVPANLYLGGRRGASSGGDLYWYRHVGREDGSFVWEGPKKIGTGWGGFQHLFSGGGGIIYGVTAHVEATRAIGIGPGMGAHPASGGDLMWARHLGREDGTFTWDGGLKKVGTGWSDLRQVFSAGDGRIYAVTNHVEARAAIGIGEGMGGHKASGGDLMWGRHLGYDDGSFRWEGSLKKVGTGWSEMEHVFAGSDGIIYAITPRVEASLATGIGPGMAGHPASGGDLMWGRHLGSDDGTFRWESPLKKVGTGWGKLTHAFSGD